MKLPYILFLSVGLMLGSAFARERPNVILIITDDQGYGDIAAHGNTLIQTPHLDQLHAESVRFTNFHVDPTCSPTRGALMSGKYSHRAKVWHTIAAGNHLRASELTMADIFKASGYRTGMFGKWHLGSNYPYRPMDRGFDRWLGHGDGGTGTTDDYFTNDRVNDVYLFDGDRTTLPGWAPDVFFEAAIDFIDDQGSHEKPFFVYLSTYIPHGPHTLPDKEWPEKYQPSVDEGVAYFFAAIEQVDKQIGQLRQVLDEEGLAENTIVMFMTDNGGTAGVNFYNAGMRGRKGSPYDGGHRVPFFIHWPNGILSHGRDVSDLTAHFDVLPTLIDLCDLKLPQAIDFDGRSFRKQLNQPDLLMPERTLFVERQRTFLPQKWTGAAAMTNRWRMIDDQELYDIQIDPGQEQNVIAKHPEVASELRQEFDAYWKHVSPGDRDRVVHIVGHHTDRETYLSSSDWYLEAVPWNHATVSQGKPYQGGSWYIETAEAGNYRFEVRRWPKEADAPMSGIPEIVKTVDAWDSRGGKPYLIYSGENSPFKALPVKAVRLKVGSFEAVKAVKPGDPFVAFEVPLKQSRYEVSADLLDAKAEVITSAYYIYCRQL